jgi:hypothetical protein
MINEMTTKDGEFLIEFTKFNGSGWVTDIEKSIKDILSPEKVTKNIIIQSWSYSEYEFIIEK